MSTTYLKAGTETGSVMNHLMSRAFESRLPAKVGDAAKIQYNRHTLTRRTAMRRKWIIVRMVKSDELRICPITHDYKPKNDDPDFTWCGPFKSQRAANDAAFNLTDEQKAKLYRTA